MTLGNRQKQTKSRKALALQCAKRGWSVAPLHTASDGHCSCRKGSSCAHAGKHPRTQNGFRDATTDRPQIKEWWSESPEANIGIATGAVSGIFVVDIDGKAGKRTLHDLESRYGELPPTVTVKTGRGRHFYFRLNGGQIRNSAGRLGKGIDVRGDGGYVVGAGSVHRSGVKYRPLLYRNTSGRMPFHTRPKRCDRTSLVFVWRGKKPSPAGTETRSTGT